MRRAAEKDINPNHNERRPKMMFDPRITIEFASSDVSLGSAPIHKNWILDGEPIARNSPIFKSRDGTAYTMIWDCTAGSFDWYYDRDETFQVLEGSAVLATRTETREIVPGTVVFLPAGSHARWRVDNYIRKVAFVRQTIPRPFGLALKVWERAARHIEALQHRVKSAARLRIRQSRPTIWLVASLTEAISYATDL
jgi:uncharacterized protein